MNESCRPNGFFLLSINIGLPKKMVYDVSKTMYSAIKKKPVSDPIFLTNQGLEGDGWADLRFHGGKDKAVCAYSREHYPYWEKKWGKSLSPGAFGENFTLSDINESIIFLGDIFQSGDVEIQVSQPRIPCHKLNKIFGRKDVVREVQRLGYTGFYFRVLKPGNIQKGDTFTFIRRLDKSVSIAETNYLLRGKKKNIKRIQQVLNLDFVSEDYKKDLRKIL